MKKIFILLFALLPMFSQVVDFTEVYGKSFLYFPTFFRPTTPEMLTPGRGFVHRGEGDRHRISTTLLTGTSTRPDKIAAYFLPNGKQEITAGELGSKSVKEGSANVIASYLGVLTSSLWGVGDSDAREKLDEYTFESRLCFQPKQVFFGAAITYRYQLSCDLDKGFWFEAVLPIVWVKNNLNFKEKVLVYGGPNGNDPDTPAGYYKNMTEALGQNKWLFGKISGPRNQGGVADIQLKLGYTYLDCLDYHLASFIGAIVPTSNSPQAEYLWEPIYGDQNQWAFMSSFNGGFKIWNRDCHSIFWEIDTCGIYYLANNQTRMLDLKNRPWSRYLWVYPTTTTEYPQQGINFTTQRVQVNQGISRDLNTAFILNQNNFNAELGYHVYAKEAERLKFVEICKTPSIGGVAAIIDEETNTFINGATKDNATINLYNEISNDKNLDGENIFKPITRDDFDLRSAACPAIFTNTFYFTVSNAWGDCAVNQLLFGALYEFSNGISAIDRWAIWLKWAIQF